MLFLFLILAGAGWYQYLLSHSGRTGLFNLILFPSLSLRSRYRFFLWRYVWVSRRWLFLVTKLFNGLMLYGLIYSMDPDDHDFRMVYLFFCFGLLGHGILIYAIRDMEEREMIFYRALPVSLVSRFFQYAFFYLLLFIPEILIIGG